MLVYWVFGHVTQSRSIYSNRTVKHSIKAVRFTIGTLIGWGQVLRLNPCATLIKQSDIGKAKTDWFLINIFLRIIVRIMYICSIMQADLRKF